MALKTHKIHKLPEVLCLKLNRFLCDEEGPFKLNGVIQLPFEGLDLRYYMDILISAFPEENSRYTLISIISHEGDYPNAGHFTCYSLNCVTNKWFHFDDKNVTQVSEDELKDVEGYILFYRKECVSKQRIIDRMKLLKSLSIHEPKNCYISKEWMIRFYSFCEPGEINNNGVKCEHDKLLNKRGYTRITYPVWIHLKKNFKGGPFVRDEEFCLICSEVSNQFSHSFNLLIRTVSALPQSRRTISRSFSTFTLNS
ncbi:hypothetical protein O3M35_005586 [Rhynocoris fuscipes]|uniref:ubiquitinyl hydrolase 1 n=1 Tax=Rhynocoris fuscipes TaxID=488301 RepID=A0AAW1DL21_9HEMI